MWEVELLASRAQTSSGGVGRALFLQARGWLSCTVVFYNVENDISCVVHSDHFTFEGAGPDLLWIAQKMKSWFEIKVRASWGRKGETINM